MHFTVNVHKDEHVHKDEQQNTESIRLLRIRTNAVNYTNMIIY